LTGAPRTPDQKTVRARTLPKKMSRCIPKAKSTVRLYSRTAQLLDACSAACECTLHAAAACTHNAQRLK
jgi:hypothetical protein